MKTVCYFCTIFSWTILTQTLLVLFLFDEIVWLVCWNTLHFIFCNNTRTLHIRPYSSAVISFLINFISFKGNSMSNQFIELQLIKKFMLYYNAAIHSPMTHMSETLDWIKYKYKWTNFMSLDRDVEWHQTSKNIHIHIKTQRKEICVYIYFHATRTAGYTSISSIVKLVELSRNHHSLSRFTLSASDVLHILLDETIKKEK